jgi:hypothetical protein
MEDDALLKSGGDAGIGANVALKVILSYHKGIAVSIGQVLDIFWEKMTSLWGYVGRRRWLGVGRHWSAILCVREEGDRP